MVLRGRFRPWARLEDPNQLATSKKDDEPMIQAMRLTILAGLAILMPAMPAFGQAPAPDSTAAPDELAFYADYAALLKQFVKDGLVDYAGLKEDRAGLDRFTRALADLDQRQFAQWPQARRLAFWINAYNALTLELIVNHYPIRAGLIKGTLYPNNSIRQIDGAWDTITFTVMGKKVTLDTIEHAIIRKEFAEPRVHMALVCAALSCPDLRGEPYVSGRLDAQLAGQSRAFLAQGKGLQVEGTTLRISAIFDWFGKDFAVGTQSPREGVVAFLKRYAPPTAGLTLDAPKEYSLKYLDYDWSLNQQPRE
jgi:hypothetical protein